MSLIGIPILLNPKLISKIILNPLISLILKFSLKFSRSPLPVVLVGSEMPCYHSKHNGLAAQELCGCALLGIKTKVRGPAPPLAVGA